MTTEERDPLHPRQYPITVLERSLTEVKAVLLGAEKQADEAIQRRDTLRAKVEGLQWAIDAIVEADGEEVSGVDYSPADGQQEVRQPRFRVGQYVSLADNAHVKGKVTELRGDAVIVQWGEEGMPSFESPRSLVHWDPPRNSAGVPLIVGNTYHLHRPGNSAQHNRTVKLREELTNEPGRWHVEFLDSNTDGMASGDELK